MKNFIKRFWSGLLATISVLLLAIAIWAVLTVATAMIIVSSPVLLVWAIHGSYKVASVTNVAKKFLDDLEEVLDNAEEELDNAD